MTTVTAPNESSVADRLQGPCPNQTNPPDSAYPIETAPCNGTPSVPTNGPGATNVWVAARSYHPGGVIAAKADGSIDFYTNGIDISYWRSLGTRAANDIVNDQ